MLGFCVRHSLQHQERSFVFLLAGLLSVRYAPVSERSKACKEAKAKQKQQKTRPNQPKTQQQHKNPPQQKTPKPPEAFAVSETSETAFTRNR